MEKKKFELKAAEPEIKCFELRNGDMVSVASYIPYHEKEEMALAMADAIIQADEKVGVCYEIYIKDMLEGYLFARYYTDIDVEDADPEKVFDYLVAGGKYEGMKYHAAYDLMIVMNMVEQMFFAVKARFEKEASLGQMVKELLNTEPDTENAETRELIEKLIDMKGALLEKQEQAGGKKIVPLGINLAKKKN